MTIVARDAKRLSEAIAAIEVTNEKRHLFRVHQSIPINKSFRLSARM